MNVDRPTHIWLLIGTSFASLTRKNHFFKVYRDDLKSIISQKLKIRKLNFHSFQNTARHFVPKMKTALFEGVLGWGVVVCIWLTRTGPKRIKTYFHFLLFLNFPIDSTSTVCRRNSLAGLIFFFFQINFFQFFHFPIVSTFM